MSAVLIYRCFFTVQLLAGGTICVFTLASAIAYDDNADNCAGKCTEV